MAMLARENSASVKLNIRNIVQQEHQNNVFHLLRHIKFAFSLDFIRAKWINEAYIIKMNIYTYIFYSNQEARIKSSFEFSKRDCARAQEVTICSSIHVTTSLCIHKVSHAFFIQYYIKVNAITHWNACVARKCANTLPV